MINITHSGYMDVPQLEQLRKVLMRRLNPFSSLIMELEVRVLPTHRADSAALGFTLWTNTFSPRSGKRYIANPFIAPHALCFDPNGQWPIEAMADRIVGALVSTLERATREYQAAIDELIKLAPVSAS